ncbi:sensor domain-containing diguanylate cyclase [Sulfurimonas sp.]|uniref:sensor domain-containing diguanylate cyclase n=1 Tax=Sulfurimonas sp. TaxID=2022749 RepID=UPI003D11811B
MQTFNTYYTSKFKLEQFVQKHTIEDSKHLLIQIFTSLNDLKCIQSILDILSEKFPQASVIGATTDGEIKNGKVTTDTTVISFSIFKNVSLQTYISGDFSDYFQAGQQLASSLIENDTQVIISFIDGLGANGEEYLNGINSIDKNILVAGGLAGDNATFQGTYVFDKKSIYSKGVVGVSLSSKSLKVFTDFSFSWQPIGKTLKITKAEKNRVYTIDDKTTVDTYQYYLGNDISKQLPFIGIEFPLIIQRDGLNIARAPISKENDGSLIFAGNLKNGDKVRFGYGELDEILSQTQPHIDKLYDKSIETIFMYSCMARRRFIPEDIQHETLVYNQIAPTSGFFTYGEFFSTNNKKELLNQSLTILALSESNEYNKQKIIVNPTATNTTAIQALSHLINVSTKELDEAHAQLKLLASTDPLTKLYNRRYFTDISEQIFKMCMRNSQPLATVMLDIDKFKDINDTYGHAIGDLVLTELSNLLKNSCRDNDVVCRYGGEEFVLLLPRTNIDGANKVAQNIKQNVEKLIITTTKHKTFNFTVSLGVSEINFSVEKSIEKSLSRADKALYIAKNEGRNQVVVK